MSAITLNVAPQPTAGRRKAIIADFAAQMREQQQLKRDLGTKARPALARLVDVCRADSGQSLKVRALLYSLWNGKAASLLELLALDWPVRLDVLAVCAAFGGEDACGEEFFYKSIENAIIDAGLWDWWMDEADEEASV